jgi:hypothetical protein
LPSSGSIRRAFYLTCRGLASPSDES